MVVMVALAAASALTLLTLRSMAVALAHSVEARPAPTPRTMVGVASARNQRRSYYQSREAAMLMVEIALSAGIALTSIGLASMAALPVEHLIGALLAQVAVLGSLVAPAVTTRVAGVSVRPAALALGVAQLANLLFFISAIQALL